MALAVAIVEHPCPLAIATVLAQAGTVVSTRHRVSPTLMLQLLPIVGFNARSCAYSNERVVEKDY